MLRMFARLLKAMNSEAEPGQISIAFCFAMVAGLTPLVSAHNLIILFLVMILRVNVSAFIVGLGMFSALAYLLDPLFHQLGLASLQAPSLKELWTEMYNSTFWRLFRFNNSIALGSLFVSLTLFIPLYIAVSFAVVRYRRHVLEWVDRTRIMQFIRGTKFYRVYQSLSELRGGL
jgi:uncharacterized protein (TIGR03546 family)